MKKIIKWIAILIIVAALGVKFAIIVNRNTSMAASSALRTTVVENQDPVRYGRIVLTDRYQTIEIGNGRSCSVAPVEDCVRVQRLVNGNIDDGVTELRRKKTGPRREHNTVGRVLTDSYKAADGSQIGLSLVYCTFPEGQSPDPKTWDSRAIASTIR